MNVAAAQLRALIERVERVEEDVRDRNADKSEIYKEAKGLGLDVKVMKKIIAARRIDTHVREEQDAVFELYWDALHGSSRVHAREDEENSSSASPRSPSEADEQERGALETSRTTLSPSDQTGGI